MKGSHRIIEREVRGPNAKDVRIEVPKLVGCGNLFWFWSHIHWKVLF